ncbi:MAG: helix-turn-helix domain-containing protein [Blastocatellia bacterium]
MSQALHSSESGCRASTSLFRFRVVERVILAMRERVDEPLSLQLLADIAIMSPYHFDRVFRQTTGIPACQFLGAIRLEKAKRLLLTTDLSVTDICFEVGYNSLGTFITRFTQLVGLPPRRLRQLAKKKSNSRLGSLPDSNPQAADSKAAEPIRGRILAEDAAPGPVFVGLFPRPIPQGRPAGCALLNGPGDYALPPVPDGSYYAFAAAFRQSDNPVNYLLPDMSKVRVGVSECIEVRDNQTADTTDVMLRPIKLTDPPLLVALPFLLHEQFSFAPDESNLI